MLNFSTRSAGLVRACSVAWILLFCVSCTGRAGEELQYNQGRIEFALPALEESNDVESFAQRRIESDIATLRGRLEQARVTDALKRANAAHADLQLGDIINLDDLWQGSPPGAPFIEKRLDAGCTAYIERVARAMPDMVEIFVTDRKGLVVCQSAKTTDYYQADEQWWIDAYAEGKGRPHHGPLEFDRSANTYAVSIYVPVTEAGTVLGVAKGAIAEAAFEEEGGS
jgi:hypothetical protein